MKIATVFHLEEGRAYAIWNRWARMEVANKDTWASLFKTQGWKRRVAHLEKLENHGRWLVNRMLERQGYFGVCAWTVKFQRKDKYRPDSPYEISVHIKKEKKVPTMQIDWKTVAKSPGYRSLKAAYVKRMTFRQVDKDRARMAFKHTIGRITHRAARLGLSFEKTLNVLEEQRVKASHNWESFYSNHHLPKLPSGKPRNVEPGGHETHLRRMSKLRGSVSNKDAQALFFQSLRRHRLCAAREARAALGKKPRWTKERKRHSKRQREYRQQQSL